MIWPFSISAKFAAINPLATFMNWSANSHRGLVSQCPMSLHQSINVNATCYSNSIALQTMIDLDWYLIFLYIFARETAAF